MTEARGPHFQLKIPADWGIEQIPDGLVVAAPPAEGFQVTIVLRESRSGTASVADLAQATAVELSHQQPGAYVYRATADTGPLGERRRIFAMMPLDDDVNPCVSVVVDYVVSQGIALELTATYPTDWGLRWERALIEILDSVVALETGAGPELRTESTVPQAMRDEATSLKLGRAIESLAPLHGAQTFAPGGRVRLLSAGARSAFLGLTGGGRLFAPKLAPTSPHREELTAEGFVDHKGGLTDSARELATLYRRGQAWEIQQSSDGVQRNLQGWTHERRTLIVAEPPLRAKAAADHVWVGYVPTADLWRVALSWADVSPAWPSDEELAPHSIEDLIGAAFTDQPLNDSSSLATQVSTYVSLTCEQHVDDPLIWLWAEGSGPLVLNTDDGDRVIASRQDSTELWFVVCTFITEYLF